MSQVSLSNSCLTKNNGYIHVVELELKSDFFQFQPKFELDLDEEELQQHQLHHRHLAGTGASTPTEAGSRTSPTSSASSSSARRAASKASSSGYSSSSIASELQLSAGESDPEVGSG